MKRLAIKSLLLIVLLFTAVPAFAADAEYDSNGVTAFYGKYEYPKKPTKKEESQKEGGSDAVPEQGAQESGHSTTGYAGALPSYKGEGTIIPATGDTSNVVTSLIGVILLAFVFFKLKEVENTETHTIR